MISMVAVYDYRISAKTIVDIGISDKVRTKDIALVEGVIQRCLPARTRHGYYGAELIIDDVAYYVSGHTNNQHYLKNMDEWDPCSYLFPGQNVRVGYVRFDNSRRTAVTIDVNDSQ